MIDDSSSAIIDNDILFEVNNSITRVQLLENIERALSQKNCIALPTDGTEPDLLDTFYPTLQEHSQHWRLNDKQHKAFLLMSGALLQHAFISSHQLEEHLSVEEINRISRIKDQLEAILPSSKQLLMFLGGCGGTGKSRIIQAFNDFSRRWHLTSSVVVSASSGIAAMLIGGCTLHSALGIGTQPSPPKPSPDMINSWSRKGLLIIDEVSMIRASMIDLLDNRLRILKSRLHSIFGGIHIIFSGDFYQLSPVGTSVISTESNPSKDKNSDISSMRGQELWKSCLTDAIILEDNLRQSDPEWAASLLRWRENQPTKEDILMVNSRYINNDFHDEETPIAVCDNESREQALRFFQSEMMKNNPLEVAGSNDWRTHGVLLIQARVRKVDGHQPVHAEHEEYVRRLGSKRLGGAGNLYCIKGTPYMVTKNQNVKKGVANGTIATLIDVILKEDAKIRVTVISGQSVSTVFADEVLSLILRHSLKLWENDHSFPSLPHGCFPLKYVSKNIVVPLGKNEERFTVKTTLFPCEISTILTAHKMQGQTVDSIVLGNLSPIHKYGRSGLIYVVFSRVTSINGLNLMVLLDENPLNYKPRIEIKEEMKRLKIIEKKTIDRLHNI